MPQLHIINPTIGSFNTFLLRNFTLVISPDTFLPMTIKQPVELWTSTYNLTSLKLSHASGIPDLWDQITKSLICESSDITSSHIQFLFSPLIQSCFGLGSALLQQVLQAEYPSCHPSNSIRTVEQEDITTSSKKVILQSSVTDYVLDDWHTGLYSRPLRNGSHDVHHILQPKRCSCSMTSAYSQTPSQRHMFHVLQPATKTYRHMMHAQLHKALLHQA